MHIRFAVIFILLVESAAAKIALDVDYRDLHQDPGMDEFGLPMKKGQRDFTDTKGVYLSWDRSAESRCVRSSCGVIDSLSKPGFAAPHYKMMKAQNNAFSIPGIKSEGVIVGIQIHIPKNDRK